MLMSGVLHGTGLAGTRLLWRCSRLGSSTGCETVHLNGSNGQGSSQGSHGLQHILQGGTFSLTRQFILGIELRWWLLLSPILGSPPSPFLGVDGGAVFLDLGVIIVREQKQTIEKWSALLPHVE